MTPAERDLWHADFRARSHEALHGPEYRDFIEALKSRCAAARRPVAYPKTEIQDLYDRDRAEGGPDLVQPLYGAM